MEFHGLQTTDNNSGQEILIVQEAKKRPIGKEANIMAETHPKKFHFVLVHGIGGGAWCFYKVRSLLEISGHKVSCLDLKSAGIDPSDPNSILSFDDYNKPLLDFMEALPDYEQVVLVGHSAGGLNVTQATHMFSKKISLAVYVAATMLKLGFLTDEDSKDGIPDLSEYGDIFEFGYGLGPDQPPTSAIMKKEFSRIGYNTSPEEDSTLASMLSKPAPILAITNARFKEENEVANVPRVYIKTMQDQILKPRQQDAMIKRWTPSEIYALDSDHNPTFSSPFLLSGLLVIAATKFGCR